MSKFTDHWKGNHVSIEKSISKETLDSYIKRLNISAGIPSKVVDATRATGKSVDTSFAGGVPVSLLSAQDLEYTTKKITVKKDDSDHDLTIEIHNGSEETAKAVFEGTELAAIAELENYQGYPIFITPEMQDTDGKRIGCFVLIGQDGSLQVFFSLKDARDFIDAVLVMNKGVVEETGKDLIEAAEDAKDGDDSTTDVVANIKAIQVKRQKATIQERSKEKAFVGKSFKDMWPAITKMDNSMAMYWVKVIGANGLIAFERYGLMYDDMKEVMNNVETSYPGYIIECGNDLGFRQVYAPE